MLTINFKRRGNWFVSEDHVLTYSPGALQLCAGSTTRILGTGRGRNKIMTYGPGALQLCAGSTTRILGTGRGRNKIKIVLTKTKPTTDKFVEFGPGGKLVNSRADVEFPVIRYLAHAFQLGHRYAYGEAIDD